MLKTHLSGEMSIPMTQNKGGWEQPPLIHTPQELHGIAKGLLSPNHEEFGEGTHHNSLSLMGGDKESAEGECDRACRWVHDYMPHGSHVVEYRTLPDKHGMGSNHFVHHVPTTDGTYVVDYTQRQFQGNAKLPVVEHFSEYGNRRSMQKFKQLNMKHPENYRNHPDGTIDYNQ